MRHAPTSRWARCARRSGTSGAPGAKRPSSERLTSAQQSAPTDRPGCSSTLPTGMSADPFDSLFDHHERARKPGWRKALPWILGIVAVGAVVAIVIAVLPSSSGHKNAALTPSVPAKIVSQVPKTMKVDYSYKNEALIEVALLTKPKSGVKSQLFTMTLDKVNGKWVVNQWAPRSVPFVHSQD